MTDWFDTAADGVGSAARLVNDAIQQTVDLVESSRAARHQGVPMSALVDDAIASGIRDVRAAAADAFHEFERAVGLLRGGIVRTLVDENGMSFTEVARRMAVSRQVVSKLYEQAGTPDDGPR